MEIFNYKDLGNKRWDYHSAEDIKKDGISPLLTTNEEINMGDVLIINSTAYTVSSRGGRGNVYTWCLVDKIKNQQVFSGNKDASDINYTSEIVCPFCGNEVGDSWEMEGEEDYECGNCQSHFSYQRHVTVEYCSQPLKKSEVKMLI